jgi:cell division protein FtsZ
VAIAQKDHLSTQVRQFSPLAHPVDFLAVLPPAPGDLPPGTALAEAAYVMPEMIMRQGLIGIDFTDVRTILQETGDGHMAVGFGKGAERGGTAAAAALDLLEEQGLEADRICRALATVHGPADLSLDDFDLASSILNERLKPDANWIIALHTHPDLHDQVRVSIAAGAKDVRIG